jgi:predicted PurR-regulated permease PerM
MKYRPPGVPKAPELPTRRKTRRLGAAILYLAMVALAVWVIRDFVPAIAWACVVAIALWPVYHWMGERKGLKGRNTAIATMLTSSVAVLVLVPIGIGLVQATDEAHDLISRLDKARTSGIPVPDFVQHLPVGATQVHTWWVANLAHPLGNSLAARSLHRDAFISFGRHFGARAAHELMLFGLVILTLFVIFRAGPKLSKSLMKGVQRTFGDGGQALAERMATAVRGTVSGLVIVGIGEGALLFIAYVLAGMPHNVLLGFVTAIGAMLPFCAPVVFCSVALWLLVVKGAVVSAIAVSGFGFLVVFVAEHFVRPLVVGNTARLPFLVVLFGIFGGLETFGLIGIFAGPALMTALVLLWTDWADG